MEASEAEEFSQYLNEKAGEFEQLCEERHKKGAEEYGAITFLGNDVLRMMLEELADTINYCRMQAIKLLILQESLEQDLLRNDSLVKGENIQLGFDSFKGTKETGWMNRDWS